METEAWKALRNVIGLNQPPLLIIQLCPLSPMEGAKEVTDEAWAGVLRTLSQAGACDPHQVRACEGQAVLPRLGNLGSWQLAQPLPEPTAPTLYTWGNRGPKIGWSSLQGTQCCPPG